MFVWVLNTPLNYIFAKAHAKTFFSVKLSDNTKILIVLYTSKGQVEEQSNTSQITELDSSNCNFRDALIAPLIGLFHVIPFFVKQTVGLLLPFVYQVDRYFLNPIDMSSTNEITKTGIYIQKEHYKKLYSFFENICFFVFIEEIVFLSTSYLQILQVQVQFIFP